MDKKTENRSNNWVISIKIKTTIRTKIKYRKEISICIIKIIIVGPKIGKHYYYHYFDY